MKASVIAALLGNSEQFVLLLDYPIIFGEPIKISRR